MSGFLDRLLRRLADRALTVGAVLGSLALLATAICLIGGIKPVFLRSGSMSPTIPTGALAFAREVPADNLVVGDVVVVTSADGSRVTHRIIEIHHLTGGRAVLHLRGDANKQADAEEYPVGPTYRVIGHIVWLGYLIGEAFAPAGLFVLGCFVMGMLALGLRRGRGPKDPDDPGARPGRRKSVRARGPAVVAAGAVLAVIGPGQVGVAGAAAWTDPVVISGTTLTADSVPAPATFTCGGLGVLSVTFNWAAVTGATNYTVHFGSGGASTVTVSGTTTTITAALSGGTAWVLANHNYGSTTWTSVASNTRTYTVAVVSLCS